MRVYPGDDESACREVSPKRSGTTVLLDNILNELFHHSDPARRFHHRREANWYMFSSLVITKALCASFYCPTTRSYYKYRRINEQIPNELSKFRKDSVNFAKSKRSEKRPPCAQNMEFWSPKKRNFRPPHYMQVFFAKNAPILVNHGPHSPLYDLQPHIGVATLYYISNIQGTKKYNAVMYY